MPLVEIILCHVCHAMWPVV